MCQRVRMPECCDTLIYSSLTVPKGDCNIKYDRPVCCWGPKTLQHRKFAKLALVCPGTGQRTACPLNRIFCSSKSALSVAGAQVAKGAGRAITSTLNGLRVCYQGDKANKLLSRSCCRTLKGKRNSARTFPGVSD